MKRRLVVLAAIVAPACATLSPTAPRFVLIYEQRTSFCRIQVVRDTRSGACFVGFNCARERLVIVPAASDVCQP